MDTQLAERLQKLRKENNFSQEQLADELYVSRQAISKWECGAALPDTENLIALAKLYHCSIDDIVFDRTELAETNREAPIEQPKRTSNANGNDEDDEDNDDKDDDDDDSKEGKIVSICTSVTVLVSVIIYVLCGALLGKWHPAWIVFLSIPLVSTLAESIVKRDKRIFAFPVLVAAVYLMLGCIGGLWHPWWVVFILIPAYYIIIGIDFKNTKSDKNTKHENKNSD